MKIKNNITKQTNSKIYNSIGLKSVSIFVQSDESDKKIWLIIDKSCFKCYNAIYTLYVYIIFIPHNSDYVVFSILKVLISEFASYVPLRFPLYKCVWCLRLNDREYPQVLQHPFQSSKMCAQKGV